MDKTVTLLPYGYQHSYAWMKNDKMKENDIKKWELAYWNILILKYNSVIENLSDWEKLQKYKWLFILVIYLV